MNYRWIIRKIGTRILHPYRKNHFLFTLRNESNTKILDVGCGNNSPQKLKEILNKVYYVGLDVGDYNQSAFSKEYANEYHVVESSQFASKIEEYKDTFDAIICAHNIEHCDEPERVLKAMFIALKIGGRIYLSFPSEGSVNFPSRKGTLNFYDDLSHKKLPEWKRVNAKLQENGLIIKKGIRNYKPIILWVTGMINEEKSKKVKEVLKGTWEYWGFESIIWAEKYKN